MGNQVFQASRWTRGNLLFPTIIEVTDRAIIRRKRKWFDVDETTISMANIASVHIKTGLIWSEILIESSGGSNPLKSNGHIKADAQEISKLVQRYQEAHKQPGAAQ